MNPQDLLRHIPSLRRYARALTGDPWSADDLVQDTLERACSKGRLWRAGTDLRAWLFTLMHNLQVDQWRSSLRERDAGVHLDLADVSDELRAPAIGMDTGIDLQRCLLRLPAEQREVLLLVCLEDLSYQAVADITGVPIGTVMSRLSRARHRLQELMDGLPQGQTTDVPATANLRRLK